MDKLDRIVYKSPNFVHNHVKKDCLEFIFLTFSISGPRGQGFESPHSDQTFLYEHFGVTVLMIGDLFVFEKQL